MIEFYQLIDCEVVIMLFFLSLIEDQQDKDGFIAIFENHKKMIFAICMKVLKNYHLAEDAMQITLGCIAKSIKKVLSLSGYMQKAYIAKIAKNCALNLSKNEDKFYVYDIDQQYGISTNENIQDNCANTDAYKKIVKFISEMDEIYRDVLTLYYLYGLTPTEISTTMNRPKNTIQTQLRRGRQIIKEKFKEFNIK